MRTVFVWKYSGKLINLLYIIMNLIIIIYKYIIY
jgi:hypothetical protein